MSAPTAGPVRELSFDERAKWGTCGVCGAKHGEFCHADVGLQLGFPLGGGRMKDGDGAHLARLQAAPFNVREVPA